MKYKEFYVETGTKELTDAVIKHADKIGYRQVPGTARINMCIEFNKRGFFNYHIEEDCNSTKLPIQDFFKLTKEDVIKQDEPEVKANLLHCLDGFFTKLLDGRIEISSKEQGICYLLSEYLLRPSKVFSEVIDVTKWDKFSGSVKHPVPLYDVNPETAFKTHENKWDKKHPYGRNRWEFVEWCHGQVKAQIEQEGIEFPVLVKGKTRGAVVLYTGETSGVFCDSDDPITSVGEYRTDLKPFHKNKEIRILKTAKELGLKLRGDK